MQLHTVQVNFMSVLFTEGLALELEANQHQLKAKVLAPAATKTEFGQVATRF